MRIAYLTTHPIQYQAPLFRAMAAHTSIEFKAFFATDFGLEGQYDAGFGRSVTWDVPVLEGYDHTFLPTVAGRAKPGSFFGIMNPAAPLALKRFAPDAVIVHGYSYFTNVWTNVVGGLMGLPILMRGDNHLLAPRHNAKLAVKYALLRSLSRFWAGALAVGTLNREYWIHYGVPPERAFLSPYAVDNARFIQQTPAATVQAAAWRAELGIPLDAPVAGFAAKHIAVKAPEVLLRAFAGTSRKDTHALFVGSGRMEADLKALAASLGIEKRVHFKGFVNQSEMPTAYAACDVFVLPSRYEPWGLAINEAMCLGRPCIVSDQVGSGPDLVTPETGWVFPADNQGALTSRLNEAFASRERLADMGAAALAHIQRWGIPEAVAGIITATETISAARRR